MKEKEEITIILHKPDTLKAKPEAEAFWEELMMKKIRAALSEGTEIEEVKKVLKEAEQIMAK